MLLMLGMCFFRYCLFDIGKDKGWVGKWVSTVTPRSLKMIVYELDYPAFALQVHTQVCSRFDSSKLPTQGSAGLRRAMIRRGVWSSIPLGP